MSDKKPLVIEAGQLQQLQAQDQIDPNALPYTKETYNSLLIRLLVRDLVGMGFPLSPELINELQKLT